MTPPETNAVAIKTDSGSTAIISVVKGAFLPGNGKLDDEMGNPVVLND